MNLKIYMVWVGAEFRQVRLGERFSRSGEKHGQDRKLQKN